MTRIRCLPKFDTCAIRALWCRSSQIESDNLTFTQIGDEATDDKGESKKLYKRPKRDPTDNAVCHHVFWHCF
jgi:hypothetical protein